MCVFLPRMILRQGRQNAQALWPTVFQSIGVAIDFGRCERDVCIEQVKERFLRCPMDTVRALRVETGD